MIGDSFTFRDYVDANSVCNAIMGLQGAIIADFKRDTIFFSFRGISYRAEVFDHEVRVTPVLDDDVGKSFGALVKAQLAQRPPVSSFVFDLGKQVTRENIEFAGYVLLRIGATNYTLRASGTFLSVTLSRKDDGWLRVVSKEVLARHFGAPIELETPCTGPAIESALVQPVVPVAPSSPSFVLQFQRPIDNTITRMASASLETWGAQGARVVVVGNTLQVYLPESVASRRSDIESQLRGLLVPDKKPESQPLASVAKPALIEHQTVADVPARVVHDFRLGRTGGINGRIIGPLNERPKRNRV